jgi:hydrogenase-4 component F
LQPLASWGLILGSLSVLGVPLFPIFLSKLNILAGLADFFLAGLVIVLLLLFIIASSFGYYLVRAFNSKEDETELKVYNTPKSMKWPIVFIIVILLVLGLYMPGGLADLLNGIVNDLGF